jgi:hypothetical protein
MEVSEPANALSDDTASAIKATTDAHNIGKSFMSSSRYFLGEISPAWLFATRRFRDLGLAFKDLCGLCGVFKKCRATR